MKQDEQSEDTPESLHESVPSDAPEVGSVDEELEEALRTADSVETERRLLGELALLRRERRGEWKAARWPREPAGGGAGVTEESG